METVLAWERCRIKRPVQEQTNIFRFIDHDEDDNGGSFRVHQPLRLYKASRSQVKLVLSRSSYPKTLYRWESDLVHFISQFALLYPPLFSIQRNSHKWLRESTPKRFHSFYTTITFRIYLLWCWNGSVSVTHPKFRFEVLVINRFDCSISKGRFEARTTKMLICYSKIMLELSPFCRLENYVVRHKQNILGNLYLAIWSAAALNSQWLLLLNT